MIVEGPPATEEEVAEFVRASTLDARNELTSKAAIAKHFERLKRALEADGVPDTLLAESINKTLNDER